MTSQRALTALIVVAFVAIALQATACRSRRGDPAPDARASAGPGGEKKTPWRPRRPDPECERPGDEEQPCAEFGRCSFRGGVCVAETDRDCMSSVNCLNYGLCRAEEGVCVARGTFCNRSPECHVHGRCAQGADGVCKAVSLVHCSRSEFCRLRGNCSPSGRGTCVPAEEAHCRAARGCREHGDCALSDAAGEAEAVCVPGSDEDCAQSRDCQELGLCTLGILDCERRPTENG